MPIAMVVKKNAMAIKRQAEAVLGSFAQRRAAYQAETAVAATATRLASWSINTVCAPSGKKYRQLTGASDLSGV
jgi:hypothetical protein